MSKLKLECTIKRVGGTDVELPPDVVQFRPIDPTRADSPHVADVTQGQAQRLIAADARVYRLFDTDATASLPPLAPPTPPKPSTPQPQGGDMLMGSRALPAHVELGPNLSVPLGDVVREAFAASGLTTTQWNDLGEDERDTLLRATIDATRTQLATKVTPAPEAPSAPEAPAAAPTTADTNGDGVLSVRELKAGIADGSLTGEKLRELIEAEQARPEPRQSFIDVCMKALK